MRLRLVETLDDAVELKRWMGERRPILGCDTETGGFRWWTHSLRLVQFGDGETGWAVSFDHWKGLVKELLEAYEEPLVFHNAKFDLLFLEQNEVHVPRKQLHDTMPLVAICDPARPRGLKPSLDRLIDPRFSAGQHLLHEKMRDNNWDWATVPVDLPEYWAYGALDAIGTARLWEKLYDALRANQLGVGCYEVEIACLQVIEKMERRGVRIDLEYIPQVERQFRAYAEQVRAWATERYEVENLTSSQQVAAVLEREGVITDEWPKTPSGQWSMSKPVLEKRGHDHPLITALLRCRHAEKMASAYLDNFMELADDDILHPSVRPIGAITGRMSIASPSLQNLPRDDPHVRDAFIAREGNCLLLCDYDQVEMRLLAHLAEADTLVAAFNEGDVFTIMARQIFDDAAIEKADPRRQLTKNASYAKIYGAGPPKFAETAGITTDQAIAFLSSYDSRFPEVRRFQDAIGREGLATLQDHGRGWKMAPTGRWHAVDKVDDVYKLVNYLVQGTAADVLKQKIVELDAAGATDYLVLPVHDELIFDVPEDEVDSLQRTVEQVMTDTTYRVPLTVGAEVVSRWGDKYR